MKYLPLLLVMVTSSVFGGYNDYTVQYEKDVTLPACDAGNPEVKFIRTNSDWSEINNSKYRVFCVEPGDYSGKGKIVVNQSGTKTSMRYLRYYNSGDTGLAPWKQAESERAVIRALEFNGASWWVVDRITVTDPQYQASDELVDIRDYSSNNIFNRMLVEKNQKRLFYVGNGSKNITLQNSVVRDIRRLNYNQSGLSLSCVYIASKNGYGPTANVHIVNNEIYNCVEDSIQINSTDRTFGADHGVEGLVIENNDLYITPDMYTDGKGNWSRSGNYACAENAIDVKLLTTNKPTNDEQVGKILHNRMWGFRLTEPDTGLCDHNGDPAAAALMFHYIASWALVKDNIIFDSENGIWISKSGPKEITFVGNLLFDVSNKINPRPAIDLQNGKSLAAFYNIVMDSKNYMRGAGQKVDVRHNLFVNAGQFGDKNFSSDSLVGENIYYNTKPYSGPTSLLNNLVNSTVSSANNSQFCFQYKMLTGQKSMCVDDGLPTSSSPYWGGTFSSVTAASGMGIDFSQWQQADIWSDNGELKAPPAAPVWVWQ